MREISFTSQEIINNWELYDPETEQTLNWDYTGNGKVEISGQTHFYIRSKKHYYDITTANISYSTTSRFAEIYCTTEDINGDRGDLYSPGEKNPGTFSKSDGTPTGCLTFDIRLSSANVTFSIETISLTYDAQVPSREMKWSATEVTAVIGSDFTSPILSGKNLDNISYTSSDIKVAFIDKEGNVTLGMPGEAVISATVSAAGVWPQATASYKIIVKNPQTWVTETVNVAAPGTLKATLVDLDTRPNHLKITGQLNSADLLYLRSAQGKMATVSSLDLSEITLMPDNEQYFSISGSDGSGIGLGTLTRIYYLSEANRVEQTSSLNGTGGFSTTEKIYSNNLAGLFFNNATITSVILPTDIDGIGRDIFNGSAVNNVGFPSTITSIPAGAFNNTQSLLYLELPSTLTEIEEYAFASSSINTLAGGAVRNIGEYAFHDSGIEHIDLTGVETLGSYAFRKSNLSGELSLPGFRQERISPYCFAETGLTSIYIPGSVRTISECAFSRCGSLARVILPEGVANICYQAFNSTVIETIDIPSTLKYIGAEAFRDTPYLYSLQEEGGILYIARIAYLVSTGSNNVETLSIKDGTIAIAPGFATNYNISDKIKSVSLPASVTTIGADSECDDNSLSEFLTGTFYNCVNLNSVNLPQNLRCIGKAAFKNCESLEINAIPSSVEYIGDMAFQSCRKIYELTLSENLKYIGNDAFYGCTGISHIKIHASRLTGNGRIISGNSLEKVTVGPAVEIIPDKMFMDCTGLVKVVFENESTQSPALTIGNYAFSGCTSLNIAQLPERTVTVGDCAFEYVTFGSEFRTGNIRKIGRCAFLETKGMNTLIVDASLEECGKGAFSDIESLSSVHYNAPEMSIPDDSYYESPFSRSSNFRATGIVSVTIGANVNYIPENLFAGHPNLTSLVFESREQASRSTGSLLIDEKAFHKCNIRELELPDVRTGIGALAFAGNTNMATLRLGNGTENIDKQAFYQCHALPAVDVPSSVISIGEEAFYQYTSNQYPYSPNMTTAYLHFTNNPEIGYHAFAKAVTAFVPEAYMPEYLSSGAGWNTLRPYAIASFSLDKNKAEVEEGGSISLGYDIYPSEFSKMDIDWKSSDESIATVDRHGVVSGIAPGNVIITASIAYMDGYDAVCAVKVGDGAGIDDILTDTDGEPVAIYNINGIQVSGSVKNLTPGLYIVRRNGKTSKLIVK